MFLGLRRTSFLHSEARPTDYRKDFLEHFETDGECDFVAVDDAYTRRSEYYSTMKQNVLAEAVSAFRSGSRVFLQAQRSPGGLKVLAFPSSETTASTVQREAATDSSPTDLQLKDNVVSFKSRSKSIEAAAQKLDFDFGVSDPYPKDSTGWCT